MLKQKLAECREELLSASAREKKISDQVARHLEENAALKHELGALKKHLETSRGDFRAASTVAWDRQPSKPPAAENSNSDPQTPSRRKVQEMLVSFSFVLVCCIIWTQFLKNPVICPR